MEKLQPQQSAASSARLAHMQRGHGLLACANGKCSYERQSSCALASTIFASDKTNLPSIYLYHYCTNGVSSSTFGAARAASSSSEVCRLRAGLRLFVSSLALLVRSARRRHHGPVIISAAAALGSTAMYCL